MSAILFDLDGVLYESNKPIAGAADTINWFNENNIPHLFLTNTTSKSRASLITKLSSFGIDTKLEDFLTPAVAASQWLHSHEVRNIALFVPDATREEFSDFTFPAGDINGFENTKVDAVVIGDLGEQWTFEKMNLVFRTLMNNPVAQLIALGMTRYWKTNSGLQLDVGPMIKAFEYATNKAAVVTGKPSKDFFKAAVALLGEDDVVMIGDDIRGDIEAAQNAGLTSIQVQTGKYTSADLEAGIIPDAVLESVMQLPEWWQKNMWPGNV